MQSEDKAKEADQNKGGIKGLIAKFDKHPQDDKHISTYPHPLKKSGEKQVPIEHHQIHHVHHEVITHQRHHHEDRHPIQNPIVEVEQPALSVKDRIAQLQKQQSQTQNKTIQPKSISGSKPHQSARHLSEMDLDKIVKDDSSPYLGRYQSMHVASDNNDREPNFNNAVQNFLKVMTDEQKGSAVTIQNSDQIQIQESVLIQDQQNRDDQNQQNRDEQSQKEQVLQNSEQSADNQIHKQEMKNQESEHHDDQQQSPDAQNEDQNDTKIQSEIVKSQIIFVPKNAEAQQNFETNEQTPITSQENKEQDQSQMVESSGNPMLDSVPQDQQTENHQEETEPLLSSFIVSVQMQDGVFRISEQKVIQSIEKHNIDIEKELTDDNHHLWTVIDKNGKTTVYQGQIIDGVRTGHGREIQHDGTYYQGQYARNLPNGEGIIVYFDGDCYFGTFVDGQKQGVGTYIHTDRETYEGEWFDDLQEGKGFQTLRDGSTYEGEFKLGKRNGKGTYTYNKTTYIGDFVDDKKHGQGEFIWSDGRRYRGGWENNLKHGCGVMIDSNGNETPGEWIEGVKKKV